MLLIILISFADNAINAIINTDNPPTQIPVNGSLKACITPPNPHPFKAHKAIKRSTVLVAFIPFDFKILPAGSFS
ncbi:hypothetical protein [Chryseobacterium salivictor]|uniref:Uncharacterized protein n=1 Tax=Chryseobacterium salivictor TaxID=2547600 RepID=A0A4P6ZC36_9FLAO|nr:hypothetical protein [Chryseobacterium salivictor]QBO57046.1 hypothetical protein NBC122_00188 [Chryseobacterium salivictor]